MISWVLFGRTCVLQATRFTCIFHSISRGKYIASSIYQQWVGYFCSLGLWPGPTEHVDLPLTEVWCFPLSTTRRDSWYVLLASTASLGSHGKLVYPSLIILSDMVVFGIPHSSVIDPPVPSKRPAAIVASLSPPNSL